MTRGDWWRHGVIYQIYPRSFQDSDGDGAGDLSGITRRLDYVRRLGADIVWLSPFYPSPMADFGYDVANYRDVDPLFGTLADFDALRARAEALGLRLLVDLVANHSSEQHAWFRAARAAAPGTPERERYLWADPAPGGGPPNNWLSVFGGPAWTLDERSGQYYHHSFLPEQPDLNWRSPEVVEAMSEVMRFWLQRGADGFRLDAIPFLGKDPQLRDNPPRTTAPGPGEKDTGDFGRQEQRYTFDLPLVHEVLRRMRRWVEDFADEARPESVGRETGPGSQSARPAPLLLGETYLFDPAQLARYHGQDRDDELHIAQHFGLLHQPFEAAAFREAIARYLDALPAHAWPSWVLGSHDEHRLASRFPGEQGRLLALMLLTLRGTPTIYQGDELGLLDVEIPPEARQDPWGQRVRGHDLGRDPGRTPMPWTAAAPGAGFTAGEPWLPIGEANRALAVDRQIADPASMLQLYRRLLALRAARPTLHAGAMRLLDAGDDDLLAWQREHGDRSDLVVLNFAVRERPIGGELARLLAPRGGRVLLSTRAEPMPAVRGSAAGPAPDAPALRWRGEGALRLRPHEGLLLTIAEDSGT